MAVLDARIVDRDRDNREMTLQTRLDDGPGDLKLTKTEQCIVAVKYVNRVPTVVNYVDCN